MAGMVGVEPMTQDVVQRWLNERRHLLVELVALSRGLRGRTGMLDALNERMQRFCRSLIDYVSAGHFEVYAKLAHTPDGARLFARLAQQLAATTDKVVAFNEYANRQPTDRARMGSALADLSLALEDRFCIEDKLLAAARARDRAGATAWRGSVQMGRLRHYEGADKPAHHPASLAAAAPRGEAATRSNPAVSVRRGQRAAVGV